MVINMPSTARAIVEVAMVKMVGLFFVCGGVLCEGCGGVFNSEAFGKIIFYLYQRLSIGLSSIKRIMFLPLRIIYLAAFRSPSLPTFRTYQYASTNWQQYYVMMNV